MPRGEQIASRAQVLCTLYSWHALLAFGTAHRPLLSNYMQGDGTEKSGFKRAEGDWGGGEAQRVAEFITAFKEATGAPSRAQALCTLLY